MKNNFSSQAAFIYAQSNSRLTNTLAIIQALIEGRTLREIINSNIAPNLSIRAISAIYYKFRKQVQELQK